MDWDGYIFTCLEASYVLDVSLFSDVFAEVPNGPGLLHRQGAADHRTDVCEGPGGGNSGKRSRDPLSNTLFVLSCTVL